MRTKLFAFLLFFSSFADSQSFRNPRRVPLTETPTAVLAGDLNGDGLPDLVYGTGGMGPSTALHSLLADGKGGYAPGADLPLPVGLSTRCQLGDLNGDKHLDLLCVGFNSEQVAVFLGKGDGSFAAGMLTALPDNGDSSLLPAAIADLNGDGKPDAVVLTGGIQQYILLNDGTGKLSVAPPLAGTVYARSVQVADLNGDGKPDLLVQGGTLNTEVQYGNGDGTFTRGQEFGGNAGAVLADMDGDGHPDIVAGALGILKIFHGNADGTFGTTPIASTDYTDGEYFDGSGLGVYLKPYAVLDLNGDGIPDVLAYGVNGLTVFLGQRGLTFAPPRSFPVGEDLFTATLPSTQQLIDMDGDGHLDFVSIGPNGVYISYGRADGTFASADVYASGYNVADMTVADFDEDGQPDVVTSGDVALHLSRGQPDGTFAAATAISATPTPQTNVTYRGYSLVFHGDFNADRHQDLLVSGSFDESPAGKPVLLPGHGDGTFGPGVLVPAVADGSRLLAVSDVNGDGRDDIIAEDSLENLTIYLARADGSFQAVPVSGATENTEAQTVTLGDLNGDGLPEIIFATGKELVVLPNNGGGTFGAPLRYPMAQPSSGFSQRAVSFAVGDFDGDGAPDVAILLATYDPAGPYLPSGSQIVTFYGRGSRSSLDAGSLSAPVLGPSSDQSFGALQAADLDGDGVSDLVASGSDYIEFPPVVSTFLGKRDRFFGAEQDLAAGATINSLAMADLNRDGRPDVMVGNGAGSESGNAFTVLLSQGPALAPTAAVPSGTLAANPDPVTAGANFTITVTLKLSGVLANLSGTANFAIDGTDAGMASFAGGSASISGPSTLKPGVHQLSATTSALSGTGGATYAGLQMTGQVTIQAVPSSLMLSASPNPASVGQPVNLSVLLTNGPAASAGTAAPTGAVTVSIDSTAVGSVTYPTTPATGGALQYTFSSPGTYTIAATYTGDSTHTGSTTSLTEVVQPVVTIASDFTLGLSARTVFVVLGQQGNVGVQLGSLGAYAGTLQLGDTNLPPGVTAAFSPGSVTLAAADSGTSTLQIGAGRTAAGAAHLLPANPRDGTRLLAAVAFCGWLPFGFRRRRGSKLLAGAAALLATFCLQGCGFSGVPLITPGTYQVTVTATDTATHKAKSAPLTLVIVTQSTQVPSAPNR